MSIQFLPQELFHLIGEFSNKDSMLNLRVTSKHLLNLIVIYSKSEVILDFTRDYSQFAIQEVILDFREKLHDVEMIKKFIDENIEKTKSFVIKLGKCSKASFEFIEKIFERSSSFVESLKLELNFIPTIVLQAITSQFLSKFTNLTCLLVTVSNILRYYLDPIIEGLENTQFTKLKKFELLIRSNDFSFIHFEKLEKIIQILKPNLEELVLEFSFVDYRGEHEGTVNSFIKSLEHIPIINLRFVTFHIYCIDAISYLSERCQNLSLMIEQCRSMHHVPPLYLEKVELSRLEILYPVPKLKLNSHLKELNVRAGNQQFLQDNVFNNLKRLEIDDLDINLVSNSSLFPKLEFVKCTKCTFAGIDIFTNNN